MVLNKRIIRELKRNKVRYGALFFLIVLTLSIVVGMAAAVDATNYTEDKTWRDSNVEDGEFSVFVPFTTEQIAELEEQGIEICENNYMDITVPENSQYESSVLRVYKNRNDMNKVTLDQGRNAVTNSEIVLEKNYCTQHSIHVNDSITFSGKTYTVTGIGSVPDYAIVKKKLSDVSYDALQFGLGFVSDDTFSDIENAGEVVTIGYSYKNHGTLTDTKVKEYLADMDFDESMITNQYMKEIVDTIENQKNDMKNGTSDLADGSGELKDAITQLNDGTSQLSDGTNQLADGIRNVYGGSGTLSSGLQTLGQNNQSLCDGASQILDSTISQVESQINGTQQLAQAGLQVSLTRENYAEVLEGLSGQIEQMSAQSGRQELMQAAYTIQQSKAQIDNLKSFVDAVQAYTNGVSDASQASTQLAAGLASIQNGADGVAAASSQVSSATSDLLEGASNLNDGMLEMNDTISDFVDDTMQVKYVNLTYFIQKAENSRITGIVDDAVITKYAALIVGVIVILLFAYILSIFVIHNIEQESTVIGALYSLGYVKKELLKHFMILPMLIVTLSGVLGTVLGYQLIPLFDDSASSGSMPNLITAYRPYLFVYGIAVPIMIAVIVNLLVVNKKLSLNPLKLLRNERKQSNYVKIDLKNMGFVNKFRIRQLLREMRGNVTMYLGLLLSILLLTFGFCIYGSIDHYVKHTADDLPYKYMYLLNFPPDEVPADTEASYVESLSAYLPITGGNLDVTLQGIDSDSNYFDFDAGDQYDVYVSNSVAEKFGYKKGDSITLDDTINNKNYTFHIKGIVNFTSGLYIFMDMNNMREVFGQKDNYYNAVISDTQAEIAAGRIESVISVEDIVKSSQTFYSMMSGLITIIISVSVIVFILVMYLLLKMMIDKATFSISLIKVFGYTEKEIRKIYLGSARYVVMIAALTGIPISKKLVDIVYPYLVSNVAAGLKPYLYSWMYLVIFIIIAISYMVVNFMVARHLKKVSLVEILKDRE